MFKALTVTFKGAFLWESPRSLGPWCIKGTEETLPRVDTEGILRLYWCTKIRVDLGLICLVKKRNISFWIEESNLGFSQLKQRTLNYVPWNLSEGHRGSLLFNFVKAFWGEGRRLTYMI